MYAALTSWFSGNDHLLPGIISKKGRVKSFLKILFSKVL
jgi:hypothetical protein